MPEFLELVHARRTVLISLEVLVAAATIKTAMAGRRRARRPLNYTALGGCDPVAFAISSSKIVSSMGRSSTADTHGKRATDGLMASR